LGAKLTGGGGGGSIIAICEEGQQNRIVNAIRGAGYQALPVMLGADASGA
jgi:hydroxymethylglutaryl-CoA reductase